MTSPSEPLATEQSSWSATLRIPTLLFMGSPQGSYITQHYSVYSNGTFSVSDDHGNTFSFDVPVSAIGTTASTSLVGNSTMAVQDTRVMAGLATAADVKLTYSVYDQFCQPAGIRIEITGSENWGTANVGDIRLTFNKKPVSVVGERAYFGNTSGVALGFDWSDSQALNPMFNRTSNSITYRVGPSFAIDPVTITTSGGNPFSGPPRPLICFANGYFIAFLNTNGYYYYSSSKDGITWSGLTLVNEGSTMSIWCSGATIYWAAGDYGTNYKVLYWNVGTVSSTGSINWSYGYGSLLYTFPFNAGNPSIAVNSTGGIFIFDAGFIFMAKSAAASSWNVNFSTACNAPYTAQLVPLTAGKVACIQDSNYDNDKIGASVWSGSGLGSWSTMVFTSASDYWMMFSQAVAIGDSVYVAASTESSAGGYLLKFSGGSWASPVQLVSSSVSSMLLNTDGHSLLVATYGSGTYDFQMTSSWNNGSTWTNMATVVSTPQPDGNLAGSIGLGPSDLVAFDWGAGTASPYDVEFAAVPAMVPQAALSANSWAKPGLSPYESYFSQSSDYVSPGNGLVSVEVGTLDLPGRGLDFAPTLVYGEPSAFQTSTPAVSSYSDNTCTSATSCTVNVATTLSPTMLYLTVLLDKGQAVSSVTSSPALGWQKRGTVTLPTATSGFSCSSSSGLCDEEVWYAVASSPFSGSITVTTTGSSDVQLVALVITGGTAFDSGVSSPCKGTATSGEPSCNLTTKSARDLIIGAEVNSYGQGCSPNSLFAVVGSATSTYPGSTCLEAYAALSTQSNLAVTVSAPACNTAVPVCAILGDAISSGALGEPYAYDNYTSSNIGYGWSLNFPWLGANYLHLTDGEAFPYEWNGNLFQYNGVTNFVLTKNTGGTYTLNMSSGTLYRFDTSKRLISITDRTVNNKITFSYGSNNYISQVADTVGRVITFSYNSNNQLTGISEGGRTWTLGYTGNQLTSLADPISSDPFTTFQYAGTTGANAWLLSAVLWPTQGKVTYTYSSAAVGTEVSTYYVTSRNVYYGSGLLSESQSISSSLINGQMVWSNSTISDGTTIRSYLDYNFQTSKNVMKLYAYDGTKTLQRISETDSDKSGRTNETRIISPTGAVLAYSTYSYDSWGNMIYSRNNVGQQTWYSYANAVPTNSFGSSGCSTSFYTQTISSNVHDRIVGECDYQNGSGSPQQQTYYEYGSNGNLLEEKVLHNSGWLYTDYTYDSYGNMLTLKNANGYTTYYRYSSTYSSAYLTKQSILVGTQNVTTTYTYNSNTGDMLSETDPNGQTTSYQYDALDRVTQVTYPAISGVSTYTYYYYYGNNNTMKIVDQNGHVTKDYFDGLSRETEVQRWNGTSAYSAEYYTYNWLNEVATKTTAAGNTYTYYYDWDGQQTKMTNPDKSNETTSYDYVNNVKTVTDENNHQTVYAYDWNQRLISVKQYNSTSNYYLSTYSYDLTGNLLSMTDAKNNQTRYQYDDLNRLTTTTFPTSPSTQETRTYDNMGNLQTRTTANESQISYTYDALNRLTKVTYPGSGGTVTYTYDSDGNKLSMVSPSVTDYYTYDARDRLTNQTEYVGGVKYQTLYAYDGVGDITSLTYPDGYMLTMTYDGVNRLKKVGTYATLGYTVDDMISKITYGNGEVTAYTYDSRDRPTQILDRSGNTKEMDLNYTYDGTGNVLSENTQSYGYDYLSRLTSSSGPWGSITYTYDQTGNRMKTVNGTTTTVYCYGSYNRLSSYSTSSCSSPTVSYTYDANGNMISKSGGWTYSYDYENRLVKVTHSGTTVQTNSYDGNGNRVQQVAGSSTFTYSYEGLNILYEKNVTGSTSAITKHFYADGLQVAKMVGPTVYYLHEDALGNTRLETTSTVSVKFSSNYVPYGKNYGVTGKEVFMYTGKPYDSATGLYYEGARYYDPTTGRFTIQDSITGTQEDPLSLNRYIYARDNPMKIVDLAGHEWWNPISDISAACSAVSSVASGVSTEVSDVAGAVSNAWNSLPPEDQAIVTTVAIDAGAVAGSIVCPAAAPTLLGAAAGATSYTFGTLASGSTPTAEGALGYAAVGALGGGLGNVVSAAMPIMITTEAGTQVAATAGYGLLGQAGTGIATAIAGQFVNHALLHEGVAPAGEVVLNGIAGGVAGGLVGGYMRGRLGTSVGSAAIVTVSTGLLKQAISTGIRQAFGSPSIIAKIGYFEEYPLM